MPLLGLFSFVFLASKDLVQKQIALFIASYLVFAVLSEYLFGMPFSRKAYVGNNGIDDITPALVLFWACFYFGSGIKIGKGAVDVIPLRRPDGPGTTALTIILAVPLILYFLYQISQDGLNLTETFQRERYERTTWQSYLFVYFVAIVSYYRNSRLLLVVGILAATSHMLTGERQRAFVYVIAILINYFQIDTRRNLSTAFLVGGFLLATTIGQLRSLNFGNFGGYNMTHWGEVTVSSLHLLDLGSTLTLGQRLDFFVGTLAANLVPSTWVPESHNIKDAIEGFARIPGGGWLPTFLQVQSGIIGMLISGLILGRAYRWILTKTRVYTSMQPAFYAALITIIATTPIWFMYTPYQLVKMPLYAFILSALILYFSRRVADPSRQSRRQKLLEIEQNI